ncbi:MAG TPA: acyl-CoA dehydrogenase family protein [Planctomycetota bacterium]|nr:acyl-CoA dehydrogenase family protein [Planctomycetota bacterium]
MSAFLDGELRDLRARARAFAAAEIEPLVAREDGGDEAARDCFRRIAASGLLRQAVPEAYGGSRPEVSFRALCVVREELAAAFGLADVLFAMQGLGSYAVTLAGDEALRRRFLPAVASGQGIAGIAITEPEAGSDAASVACAARRVGGEYVLDGTKTLVTNAGIADFYTLLARTGPAPGARGLSTFLVEKDAPGFRVSRRFEILAPHPIGELEMRDCRVPASQRIGEEGEGFKILMRVLDAFRATVGAAAVGIARRALAEALARAKGRVQFGRPIAELQAVQFPLAESAAELDAARLLVHRAAALLDEGASRVTRESAAAKLFATEAAQRIVDRAVQIHGGLGVVRGVVVERLYREVRALRIYEGTTEILKGVLAGRLLEEGLGEG